MDFYERKRRTSIMLAEWIKKDKRGNFSALARETMVLYGIDITALQRILEKNYPGLTIKDDQLEKA